MGMRRAGFRPFLSIQDPAYIDTKMAGRQ